MGALRIEDYLKLPYTIELQRNETYGYKGWFASVKEFEGCLTQADRFEDLMEVIEDAMRAWIKTAVQDGREIPPPRPE